MRAFHIRAPFGPPAPRIDVTMLVAWTLATTMGGLLLGLFAHRVFGLALLGLAIVLPLPQAVALRWYGARPWAWLRATALGTGLGIALATVVSFIVIWAVLLTRTYDLFSPVPLFLMVAMTAASVASYIQARLVFGDQLRRTAPWIVANAIGGICLAWSVSFWWVGVAAIHDDATGFLIATIVAAAIHGMLTGLVLSRDLEPAPR